VDISDSILQEYASNNVLQHLIYLDTKIILQKYVYQLVLQIILLILTLELVCYFAQQCLHSLQKTTQLNALNNAHLAHLQIIKLVNAFKLALHLLFKHLQMIQQTVVSLNAQLNQTILLLI